jgi:Xaa-Pro aminopeptidase
MLKFGLLCAAASVCAFGGDPIPHGDYRARRVELQKKLDGVMVVFGRVEGMDEVFRYPQRSNFYYLTGWTEPGAIALITPKDEKLFLPHRNKRGELYTGRRSSAEDADVRQVTGFETVLPGERFEGALREALDSYLHVYVSGNPDEVTRLKALLPFRETENAGTLIAGLRMKKTAAEVAAIRHATDVSMEAHRAAWKRVRPGTYEYQAAATFTATLLEAGCEGNAYEPIFGSGPNSTILHYSANSRRMDSGEVIVIDAAAQCGGYASDITRTLPVNGKFTPRERELYGIVLGAQQAVIDAIKPGVPMADLTKIAREYIDKHGKDSKGDSLGKYLLHGVSHHVGLDVHDPGAPNAKLEEGMVITVEPGVYLADEGIGIRIEDVILVTADGATVLSAALPRSPEEVEKAMAQ